MRKDARENLERVLAAAPACFAEHEAAVTMEEVARRAGVGTGTLYRRLLSRAALLNATMRAGAGTGILAIVLAGIRSADG